MNDVNPNLMILLQKLVSDEELAWEFSNCKTLDEFYDFCSKITSGYTKEELHELIISLSLLTFREKNNKIILKDDLEKVSGGVMMTNINKKYLSGILGVLSFVSTISVSNLNAGAEKPPEAAIVASTPTKVSEEESVWVRLAEDIAVGSAAGAIVGTAVYYALKASDSVNSFGLPNMGVSCYINATVQQLYGIRAFREAVMADNSGNKRVAALKHIFSLINKGEVIKRSDIEESIQDLGYHDKQEDAMEFLLHGLGKLLQKYGLMPGNKSLEAGFFSDPLDIQGVPAKTSLAELLKHSGGIDTNLVHQKIKELQPETKKWKNDDARWSEKRAEFLEGEQNTEDWKLHAPAKIKPAKGQFGVIINRTAVTAHGNVKLKKAIFIPDIMVKDGVNYYLTGAEVHMGPDMNAGHYYSYKRDARGRWLCYNDSKVSVEDENDVRDDMEHNGVLFVYTAVT